MKKISLKIAVATLALIGVQSSSYAVDSASVEVGGGEKVQRCRTKPLDDQNGHRGDGQSCWPRLPPVSGKVRPSPPHDLLVPSRRSGHDDRKVRGASKGTEPCGGASRRKRHLPQIPRVPEAQGGREAALRDQTPCPSARATNCVVAGNTTRIGPAP